MSFFRRPQYRRFEYEPRYYKPSQDPDERRRRQMRFARRRARKRVNRSALYFLLFIILVLYMYFRLMKWIE